MILSTPTTANLAVLWASKFCEFDNKVLVREATTLSCEIENNNSLFFKFVKGFVKKWYNRASTVICVSDGVRKDLQKKFLVEESILKVVPNIIDVDEIKRKANSKEHGSLIESCKPYVLSMGRLEKSKDFAFLINVFQSISNEINCKLLILGEGSERSMLEKLIRDLSLSDQVYLPGYVSNPYPIIKNCEVFALSSRWEGSPNVLREALIFNKKIISTDCDSGPKEILQYGKLGKLVSVGDKSLFSKELRKLIHNLTGDSEELINIIDQSDSTQFYKQLCN